ncbi:NUDIX domain-containing protein [Paenibacillus elgii]|uniref:NUDIX domain-containing protein n=1 Tax=Paenibacillus elgii TaxID=189691 RepID=UPI0002E97097|nr:NUDIX domain-containing protein [Paenibacillus elgii]
MMIDNMEIHYNQCPETYQYVLVVLHYKDQFVFVKNKKRKWEFTGGKKEDGETILEVAKREAWEEAGAIIEDIQVVGYYTLANHENVIISAAEVLYFEDIPAFSETTEVRLSTTLPSEEELSFTDGIYKSIFSHIKEHIYES